MKKFYDYDVALSFAGEDRAYVESVAKFLKQNQVNVFYDIFEEANLWGKNLYSHLSSVYKDRANYTVIFISKHYAEKLWTNHERENAQARAFLENREYILPARFDDTEIPGILKTVGHIDLLRHSPESFGSLICQKIKGQETSFKIPSVQKTSAQKITFPAPDEDFRNFIFGKFEIPITIVDSYFEGPHKQHDVVIHFKDEFFEDSKDYPKELRATKQDLLNYTKERYGIVRYTDNPLCRIDSVNHEPEDENDNSGRLILHFSKTGYENLMATNMALEATLPDNKTVREKYGYKPYRDLEKSVMSNPPGVEAIVISNNPNQTPQRQVIIKKRAEKVNFYRQYYQVAASGYISTSHRDKSGTPSPFVTASKETLQEVSLLLRDVRPEDFKLLGIGMHWHGLYPNLIGYFETSCKAADILGHPRRDGYEGEPEAIPFTINNVINHIAENPWTPMSAFAMISVLLAEFPPREVEDAANKISKPKTPEDFHIN